MQEFISIFFVNFSTTSPIPLTGLRLSELLYLDWEDIVNGRIKICEKENWKPKDYEEREIPMHDKLVELITPIKKDKGRIFKMSKKKLEKLFYNAVRESGIDYCRIHDLRHTFASHLVMSNVNLVTVKELLGHADIETTMIYVHLSKSYLDDSVKKLELF